jgi:hypothetical protein
MDLEPEICMLSLTNRSGSDYVQSHEVIPNPANYAFAVDVFTDSILWLTG